MTNLQSISQQTEKLIRETGDWMKTQRVNAEEIEIKTTNNLVSFVDKESERRLVEGLKNIFPEAGFIAEEGTGEKADEWNWVIDPLDGTTNFLHDVPIWCISVALCQKNSAVIGIIFDPNKNEMFTAYQGGGSFLNGNRIQVSHRNNLTDSLLVTGFPYDDFGREEQYIALFRSLMKKTRGIRRLGSAALDLAWVACGRFEAFYEYGLNPWDVAAGAILVHEAGGKVSGFYHGDPIFEEDIIASNGLIHENLQSLTQHHFHP
ncbi:MAG: inositol monophosphatase [Bacteroidetes bacterium]|nr:inositol monophosphatase [Bacteroidota bacterium]